VTVNVRAVGLGHTLDLEIDGKSIVDIDAGAQGYVARVKEFSRRDRKLSWHII
jgi:hypothetical protein